MAVTVKKPSKPKLSSWYFQTEMSLLTRIAETTKDFNALAGYLALARHGNSQEQADPFRHTGAGLNSLKTYGHMGDATAYNVEAKLREHGFIALLPNPTNKARYALSHEVLDLALPWAVVVDTWSSNRNTVQSVLTRLQKSALTNTQKLDALMVMLNCYRADILRMADKGGIDHQKAIYREWEARVIPKADNLEWLANPKTDQAYTQFMRECLSYRIPAKQKSLSDTDEQDFWRAWDTLKRLGLVYEAVALTQANGVFVCTLRVQDYHADTPTEAQPAQKIMVEKPLDPTDREAMGRAIFSGNWERPKVEKTIPAKPATQKDPSYMREVGAEYAFYAVAGQAFNQSEHDLLKAVLPGHVTAKHCRLVGVYRPRFRTSTPDMGQWIEADKEAIQTLIGDLA